MNGQYGVSVSTGVKASRPVKIKSSTTIGIVGTGKTAGLTFYGSPEKALKAFENDTGTIIDALPLLVSQNCNCPVIVSAAVKGKDAPETKSNVIKAVEALRKSQSEFSTRPNLIVAPEFSHDKDIATSTIAVAGKLRGHAIVELGGKTETEAVNAAKGYGTRRAVLCWPKGKVWDTAANKEKFQGLSLALAGMIARTDGEREYGWAHSFSNRVVNGISGVEHPVEFIAGEDCEADRLRTAGITTIVNYNGLRAWGNDTTDIDPIWKDFTRIRVFDKICDAALDGLFWAIDRNALDVLPYVRQSVEGLLGALKGAGALLGFEVSWDGERNTKENITAGKFYLTADLQNTPIVKRLEVKFNYADRWGDVLFSEEG